MKSYRNGLNGVQFGELCNKGGYKVIILGVLKFITDNLSFIIPNVCIFITFSCDNILKRLEKHIRHCLLRS